VEELLDQLFGAAYFSKIDLRSRHWQVRMHPANVPKTAFRTHEGHYEFLVVSFGLTNTPSTLRALMNHIFKPYLRKFILVFFDGMLIYSPSYDQHLVHLKRDFEVLRQHTLFAKMSKCSFGKTQVEYLGNVITLHRVSINPKKVAAMKECLVSKTITELRGFLGLTGYYRRFVNHFGLISRPLIALLKKDSFQWNSEAQIAFETLKEAMISTLVLALPDFTKTFVVETDASGGGIGVVLMQESHRIAYLSKELSPKHQALST